MVVVEILKKVKANRYTYYNLSRQQVKDFQKLYSYLKRNKFREIRKNTFQGSDALQGQIDYWLNNQNELDFIKKYKVMELISTNLK